VTGKGRVVGARSPRWAVWKRMDIRDRRGERYLLRLRLIDTPWFGVYLHHIEDVDPQPDPHDHPWPFRSLVLRGGYTEKIYMTDPVWGHRKIVTYQRRWLRWSWHKMSASGVAHRITTVQPRTVTLVLRGRRCREWGFWGVDNFNLNDWTHWKDYTL
jgi:hypothetical protein